jgi:hypothetical protein
VIEPGRDLDLAKEPLGAKGCGDGSFKHLEGDTAVMLEVMGEVNRGHPATAELSLERVTVLERLAQSDHGVGHGMSRR